MRILDSDVQVMGTYQPREQWTLRFKKNLYIKIQKRITSLCLQEDALFRAP